jgi:DNA repair exonuclease SbcCD ATPase subunit
MASRGSPASIEHSRDASVAASDGSFAAPPPPSVNTNAKSAKSKGKKGNVNHNNNNGTNDPMDAHKALLSKISQLEATTHEDAHQSAEIDAEVKKANRDLSQLLNTLEPEKGKLDLLQKKYSDLFAEMKRVEREHTKAKKRADQLQKEKEEIGKDRGRERSMKEKLEKLSRELTRENKKLKDDYRDLKENSAHRNDELHQRLEGLVSDVEGVIKNRHSPAEPQQEVEHDRMFREKFTSFLLQYELRELHFQSQLRVKELELVQQIARHEQLRKAQENELSKSHQLTRQVSTFSQTENELRGQLNVYVEKFKQVGLLLSSHRLTARLQNILPQAQHQHHIYIY